MQADPQKGSNSALIDGDLLLDPFEALFQGRDGAEANLAVDVWVSSPRYDSRSTSEPSKQLSTTVLELTIISNCIS